MLAWLANPSAMSNSLLVSALFLVAAALRVHNAWLALPLSGYDGPFHAANIGIILFEGRLPLPHEGWSTFHPPFYYAVSAFLWKLLPAGLSAHGVLFALRLLNVAAGLALGLAVYLACRRVLPARPRVALCASALALFLPMQLGPSYLVGNEMFGAALAGGCILLLLAGLDAARPRWALPALGVLLGLAALTKFNTLVVLATVGLALTARGFARHGPTPRALVEVAAVFSLAALVAGWYFAWNQQRYGRPILMQNEIVSAQMSRSGYGPPRALAEYLSPRADILLLDPKVMLRPARDDVPQRKAVWPVTFGTIWFDLHFSMIHASHPRARIAAWPLYACGAIFTVLAIVGARSMLRAGRGEALPRPGQVLVVALLLALTSYVLFTWRVATYSALKGVYLSPALLPFCVLVGVGCDRAAAHGRTAARAVAVLVLAFVVSVCVVFWEGGLAPRRLNIAHAYLLAHTDEATLRVYEYFVPPLRLGR